MKITGAKLDQIARAICIADGFNPARGHIVEYDGAGDDPQNERSIPTILRYRRLALIAMTLMIEAPVGAGGQSV